MRHRLALLALISMAALSSLGFTAGPPVAVFGQPSAEARLGGPITFQTSFTATGRVRPPERVEVLLRLPTQDAETVLGAEVGGGPTEYTATATLEGHLAPNTTFVYRFRARDPAGDALGPEGTVTVVDDRVTWRTVSGPKVRLHWHEGDQAFAERALEVGETAIARATELLGVTDFEPVDFFIYADQATFTSALGARTGENVGGQAHGDIRTMFGLIEPNEINSSWVDRLVTHELTHLVFNEATDNPYHRPPVWLNEGIADYLSLGRETPGLGLVEDAARDGRLMPLEGLSNVRLTELPDFSLAYAQSLSAVIYFVDTYGEEELWQLVRSYAAGVSDDDAFTAATGADVDAFNAAWMASLGQDVPAPLGPQPAPPGSIPPGWEVEPAPTATAGAPTPAQPRPTTPPAGTPTSPGGGSSTIVAIAAAVILAAAVLLVAGLLLIRGERRRGPPPPPPPPAGSGWPPAGSWQPPDAPPPGGSRP